MHWKNSLQKAADGCIRNRKGTHYPENPVFPGFCNYEVMKSMKIKIHKDVWKVKLTDGDKKKMTPDKNSYNLGLTEYGKQTINIRKGLSLSVARSTVIHELVHAFLFSYGNTVEGEEQMCDFFGVHADDILTLTDQIMERVVKCGADNRRN